MTVGVEIEVTSRRWKNWIPAFAGMTGTGLMRFFVERSHAAFICRLAVDNSGEKKKSVMPAKAGIQARAVLVSENVIPACAGMTHVVSVHGKVVVHGALR